MNYKDGDTILGRWEVENAERWNGWLEGQPYTDSRALAMILSICNDKILESRGVKRILSAKELEEAGQGRLVE